MKYFDKILDLDRSYLILPLVLVLGFAVFQVSSMGALSFSDTTSPSFESCKVNDQGDITICNDEFSQGVINKFFSGFGESTVEASGDTEFWVRVEYVDDYGDDFSPQFNYLFEQDYLDENGRQEFNEDNDRTNLDMDDVVWNNTVKSSLEMASTCSMQVRPSTEGEVVYRYEDNGDVKTVRYHEDWWADEPDRYRNINKWMDRVNVEASEIRFTKYNMYCKFDFEEIMNKGAEHTPFHSLTADDLTIKPDNYGDGYSRLNVDFELDADGDGVLAANDKCSQTVDLGYGIDGDGCAYKDADGDGVFNRNDEAPNTPGSNLDGTPTLTEKVVQIFVSNWMQGEPLF